MSSTKAAFYPLNGAPGWNPIAPKRLTGNLRNVALSAVQRVAKRMDPEGSHYRVMTHDKEQEDQIPTLSC